MEGEREKGDEFDSTATYLKATEQWSCMRITIVESILLFPMSAQCN